ncbi:uncharacterized protein BJ212DRAFT_1304106 [Suillus subaureus]|uniref:Uncharacterized protein n=1 Tax=Suillus subaureus TaxID=48587 RepID=A0A9P7J6B4_9AGAM|nr:uncharacterized protein BJ212DRAFT_1304106 [Suillus subaureus]KAG1805321.1 hypothetical protein BJ212DRAFT_1304106 [Suillus subaureus]
MAPQKQSKPDAATAQWRENHKARMQAQLENVVIANTADNIESDEPMTRVAKTAALTRPDHPMKHTVCVTELEAQKSLNEGKVQPLGPLHQCEVKKVKLTPKLSRAHPAPNPLQVSNLNKHPLSTPKARDDTTKSDLGDLAEDGEDCDGQNSLDSDDEDREFADLTVENFHQEVLSQKISKTQWGSTKHSMLIKLYIQLTIVISLVILTQHKLTFKSQSTQQEKKLQDEMPHFADDAEQKPPTEAEANSGASDTSEKICKVVRGSYEQGQCMFAFSLEDDTDLTIDNVFDMTTTFATHGTNTLGFEALVESADHEGYTGKNNMAECLLSDLWAQYAQLLVDYTTHHIHLCHTQFKKAVGVIVMSVLDLTTNSAAQNSTL